MHLNGSRKSLQNPARKLFIAEELGACRSYARVHEYCDATATHGSLLHTVAAGAAKATAKILATEFAAEQLAGKKLKAEIKKVVTKRPRNLLHVHSDSRLSKSVRPKTVTRAHSLARASTPKSAEN